MKVTLLVLTVAMFCTSPKILEFFYCFFGWIGWTILDEKWYDHGRSGRTVCDAPVKVVCRFTVLSNWKRTKLQWRELTSSTIRQLTIARGPWKYYYRHTIGIMIVQLQVRRGGGSIPDRSCSLLDPIGYPDPFWSFPSSWPITMHAHDHMRCTVKRKKKKRNGCFHPGSNRGPFAC